MSQIDENTTQTRLKRKTEQETSRDHVKPSKGDQNIAMDTVSGGNGSSNQIRTEENMELPPKPKKQRGASREELLKLSKEDLVDRLIQAEAHVFQLKNIISRNLSQDAEKEKQNVKQNQKKFDFTKCNFRPILLKVMYFGWDYQGFVVQEDTLNTIEQHLFKALTKACFIESRETSKYHRCGRTDKGVSAFGQVISINIRSKHATDRQNDPESIYTEIAYCRILNRLLPKEIRAVAWMPVPDDFSARFDCNKRQYKYYFPRSNLNVQAMKRACKHLLGSHDFRNLCKMDVGNGVLEYTRLVMNADVLPVDDDDDDKPTSMYYLLIEGNAFLWHQIRCIQAVLLLIGEGRESEDVILQLFDTETYPGKPVYNMAIDVPLNLFKCSYDIENTNKWQYEKENLEKIIMHWQEQWTIHNIKTTMLKDCLQQLETIYKDLNENKLDIVFYHDCLVQGVKPKNYVKLVERTTCPTLWDKVKHYRKRRKVDYM